MRLRTPAAGLTRAAFTIRKPRPVSQEIERLRHGPEPFDAQERGRDYLSCVEMLVKLVFSLVPRPFTTAMIATEMPAAMRPYSMAVAPELFGSSEFHSCCLT